MGSRHPGRGRICAVMGVPRNYKVLFLRAALGPFAFVPMNLPAGIRRRLHEHRTLVAAGYKRRRALRRVRVAADDGGELQRVPQRVELNWSGRCPYVNYTKREHRRLEFGYIPQTAEGK